MTRLECQAELDQLANFHVLRGSRDVHSKPPSARCSGIGSREPGHRAQAAGTKRARPSYTKQPGRLKWNDITLKRGLGDDTMKLHKWRKKVGDGKVAEARTNGTIWMLRPGEPAAGASGASSTAGRPSSSGPSLNANANETAIEELTLAVEKLSREM